jgi:hypothetical protein
MNINQKIWEKVFQKNEDIVSREIAGETMLIPIRGNLADMQRVFLLEEVAEYIWQHLNGERELGTICDGVLDNFEVEKGDAEADISEFINELVKADLIVEVK